MGLKKQLSKAKEIYDTWKFVFMIAGAIVWGWDYFYRFYNVPSRLDRDELRATNDSLVIMEKINEFIDRQKVIADSNESKMVIYYYRVDSLYKYIKSNNDKMGARDSRKKQKSFQ